MGNIFFFPWEVSLMEWAQAAIPALWLNVLSLFSLFGEEMLLICVLGFAYWCWDKKLGKAIGRSLLMANLWGPMIKNVALRLRPYFASDNITLLRKIDPDADVYNVAAQGYSFPSGHSANAVAVYGTAAAGARKRWLWVLAFVLPLLVGVSRVAVGAHFPTDVIAGWALGALSALLTAWLTRAVKQPWLQSVILLVTVLPGLLFCRSSDYFTGLGMLIGFLAAEPFERRFVRFENTHVWWRCILRVLGGVAVYLALNTLLKLPFSAEFLDGGTMAAYLVRTARYAIVVFADIALYPMLFRRGKSDT